MDRLLNESGSGSGASWKWEILFPPPLDPGVADYGASGDRRGVATRNCNRSIIFGLYGAGSAGAG